MKEERRGRESELAKEGVSQRGRTNSLASSSTLAVVCNLYLRSKHVANGRGEGDITSQPRQWRLISRLVLDTACDSVLECAVSLPSVAVSCNPPLSGQVTFQSLSAPPPPPPSSSFLGLLFRRPSNHVFSKLPASLESQRSFGPKNRNETK